MDIEAIVKNRMGHHYGRGTATEAAIRAALNEAESCMAMEHIFKMLQVEANHAIELRAHEATVANLESRIRELEAERVPSPSCRDCANSGRVNGLSQETYCDSCVWQGQSFRVNHYAAAQRQPKKEPRHD